MHMQLYYITIKHTCQSK